MPSSRSIRSSREKRLLWEGNLTKDFFDVTSNFQTISLSCLYTPRGEALTIREIIAEQRRRSRSENPAERLAAALLISKLLREHRKELRDHHLGHVLEQEVCSNLSVLAPELTVCMEVVERLQLRRDIKLPSRCSIAVRHGEGEHILHAESALYWARIPHVLLPFQRDKFASNTFMVPSIAAANDCLRQAGFRQALGSPTVLIDRETRRPIRIVERS